MPAPSSASSVGTANCGVPQNTTRLGAITPYHSPERLQLANLPQRQIALQLAQPKNKQHPVQVIDLMLKRPRQQLLALHFKPLALHILRPHLRTFAARDTFSRMSGRLRQPSSSYCLPSLDR